MGKDKAKGLSCCISTLCSYVFARSKLTGWGHFGLIAGGPTQVIISVAIGTPWSASPSLGLWGF